MGRHARCCIAGFTAASLLLLSACPSSAPATRAPEVEPVEAGAELDPAPACGLGTRFDDYTWVPADARLLTLVERHDPELPEALRTLTSLANDPAQQLPVFASLDYRNFAMQLSLFEGVLTQLGHDPAQLVEVQGPAGELAWLWPTDCPREHVAAALLETFGVLVRVDLDHPKLRHGPGSSARFPFDLITLGERRLALTLAGQGRAVGAWLDAGGVHDPEAPLPGELLADLEAAPLRSVLHGASLLGTPEHDVHTPGEGLRRLRILGSSWEDLSATTPSASDAHDPAHDPAPDTGDSI